MASETNGGLYIVDTSPNTVTATILPGGNTATPIPSTFLLAGIGMTLAGLYWMRYRRRDRA